MTSNQMTVLRLTNSIINKEREGCELSDVRITSERERKIISLSNRSYRHRYDQQRQIDDYKQFYQRVFGCY